SRTAAFGSPTRKKFGKPWCARSTWTSTRRPSSPTTAAVVMQASIAPRSYRTRRHTERHTGRQKRHAELVKRHTEAKKRHVDVTNSQRQAPLTPRPRRDGRRRGSLASRDGRILGGR